MNLTHIPKLPPRYLPCGKTLPTQCLHNIEAFFNTFDIYFIDNLTASIKKSFSGVIFGVLQVLPKDTYIDLIDVYCVVNYYLGSRYQEGLLIDAFQELVQHCATRLGYDFLICADASYYELDGITNPFGDRPGTYMLMVSDFNNFLALVDTAEVSEEGHYVDMDDTAKYIEEVIALKFLLIDYLEEKINGTQEQESDEESDEEDEDEDY